MAIRPMFISGNGKNLVEEEKIQFTWYSGFAKVQKQKSIMAFHQEAIKKYQGKIRILEVSSKSTELLGTQLSAFNLMIESNRADRRFSVECAFQSSKVFEQGGPYKELLYVDSRTAKKDERLKNSGKLVAFEYSGKRWQLEPKTMFYDWLYINALGLECNNELEKQVVQYDAFTDIEFNPEKSINCQARAVALYVSLHRRGLLKKVLDDPEFYVQLIKNKVDVSEQLKLF